MYFSSSIFLSVFSLNASIGFHLYCHWLFVYSVVLWFVFLSMFLSVSVNGCITANIPCICPSLYPFFCLSFCLWMCIPFTWFLVYMYVTWSVFLSLLFCDCLYLWSAILSLIVRIYICLLFCVFVYLSFPLCFWVSGYMTDNLRVCEQARSGRSVCNSSLENLCIIINSACIDSYFYLPLWLWRSVPVSGCVNIDCMCI